MAKILYIFYLSKILEFGDTVIMALKKNYHQISFLHVYHHSSIFCVWWVIVYFAPGGESYFSAALNSGIHVFMCAARDVSVFVGRACLVMARVCPMASQTNHAFLFLAFEYYALSGTRTTSGRRGCRAPR